MKCPHCGHSDRIHSGPAAHSGPGVCWHDSPDTPCPCPGWKYWLKADEWQMELAMEQSRVNRAFGESSSTLWEED
jgi:hypothetical protein